MTLTIRQAYERLLKGLPVYIEGYRGWVKGQRERTYLGGAFHSHAFVCSPKQLFSGEIRETIFRLVDGL